MMRKGGRGSKREEGMRTWHSTKCPMRALAMTGIVTDSMISLIILVSLIRATPPWARMSAGTRSRAMTAEAPASSAIRAYTHCQLSIPSHQQARMAQSSITNRKRELARSSTPRRFTSAILADSIWTVPRTPPAQCILASQRTWSARPTPSF